MLANMLIFISSVVEQKKKNSWGRQKSEITFNS